MYEADAGSIIWGTFPQILDGSGVGLGSVPD